MKAASWSRVREIFEQVVDLPARERGAFLDDTCSGDPVEVRREVERLLDQDSASDGFLELGVPLQLLQGEGLPPRDAYRRLHRCGA